MRQIARRFQRVTCPLSNLSGNFCWACNDCTKQSLEHGNDCMNFLNDCKFHLEIATCNAPSSNFSGFLFQTLQGKLQETCNTFFRCRDSRFKNMKTLIGYSESLVGFLSQFLGVFPQQSLILKLRKCKRN